MLEQDQLTKPRSEVLMNYILNSSDTPEMRLQAIKEALDKNEITQLDFEAIETALQNQQFEIIKKFIEDDELLNDYSEVPGDADFPKTYADLIEINFTRGLISSQQKDELLQMV